MISTDENRGWCAIFGIESAMIVIANLLVIVIFAITRSLHHKTYYLLISLAVADFLVGATALPMFVHVIGASISQFWELHTHIVYAQRSMEIFTSFASIFFLAAVAVERCIAVMRPTVHADLPSWAYHCAIGFIWFFSALLGVLSMLREAHITAVNDKDIFPVLMFFVFLTLAVVLVCYVVIFVVVISSNKLDDNSSTHVRLALTLFIVSVLFFITWLPFTVLNLLFMENPATTLSCGEGNWACVYHAVFFSKLLHYFNSFINPIIYTWRMLDFRTSAKRLLCCCCYGSAPEPRHQAEERGFDNPAVTMDSMTTVPSMYV